VAVIEALSEGCALNLLPPVEWTLGGPAAYLAAAPPPALLALLASLLCDGRLERGIGAGSLVAQAALFHVARFVFDGSGGGGSAPGLPARLPESPSHVVVFANRLQRPRKSGCCGSSWQPCSPP
jgi:hypothetical protein